MSRAAVIASSTAQGADASPVLVSVMPYGGATGWQPAPKWPIWARIWFVILASAGGWAVVWLVAVTILHRGA